MEKGTCPVDDCGDPIHAYGLCGKHGRRLIRHGDPLAGQLPRVTGTPMERYLAYTDRPSDLACHRWTRALVYGYGRFGVDGKSHLVHRWIWEQTVGPIPAGMTLDHLCHNEAAARGECNVWDLCPHRACSNVLHLALATLGDNYRASPNSNGRKTHCRDGHPYDEANTYVSPQGGRQCRICKRAAYQRWAASLSASGS